MNRTTAGRLTLLAVLAPASPLFAHTALSVTDDAIWRADLDTQTGQRLVDLNFASSFGCQHLAVSSTGLIRCTLGNALYAIDGTTGEVTSLPAPLPVPPPIPGPLPPESVSGGLTFDSADRLWLVDHAGTQLLRLDPGTGAVLSSQPLALTGSLADALAAFEDRLYAFTRGGGPILEEIDPATGTSLSAIELGDLVHPLDAGFDDAGDLWVVGLGGPSVPPYFCLRVDRVVLATSTVDHVSDRCFTFGDAVFANIAGVRGTALEIPTLDHVGRFCLLGMLLLSALIVLRRTGP